jgi:hypothetical protein
MANQRHLLAAVVSLLHATCCQTTTTRTNDVTGEHVTSDVDVKQSATDGGEGIVQLYIDNWQAARRREEEELSHVPPLLREVYGADPNDPDLSRYRDNMKQLHQLFADTGLSSQDQKTIDEMTEFEDVVVAEPVHRR